MAGATVAMDDPGLSGRVNMAFIALIVAVATIGGFMFGYDSGVINGTQEGLNSAFNLAALGTGITVGAILIGCAIGAFVAGRLGDRIGRRSVMIISALLFMGSALAAGAAGSATVFIIARIIGGLGVGAASILTPAYISEVTPAGIRGRLSSVQQVMIIIGLTGAFVANYALAANAGSSTTVHLSPPSFSSTCNRPARSSMCHRVWMRMSAPPGSRWMRAAAQIRSNAAVRSFAISGASRPSI